DAVAPAFMDSWRSTTWWSGADAPTRMRTGAVATAVPPDGTLGVEKPPTSTVTFGSVEVTVPLTGAALPPSLRSVRSRSTVSPASSCPPPLPDVPAVLSSSTVIDCQCAYGPVELPTGIAPRNVRRLRPLTVSWIAPGDSAVNGRVTDPSAAV